jgi:thiol-disulfide isomerase/thioredoxin
MKNVFVNLALFTFFSIVFSGLTACTESPTNLANSNAAIPNSNTSGAPSDSKSKEYPPLASGLANAEFELLDGSKFKIVDRKGKVLLLNIWGTWCGPCRAEMPHLIALQEKYGPQGFEVIGLNIGDGNGSPETIDQIKTFAASMKLNYTLARSPNAATAEFYKISKQQVVPQTLLVDREGHLRGMFIGGGPRVVNSMSETVEKTMSE